MNDLDKQLEELQAGLNSQIQQVQAEIDGALGASSAEKTSAEKESMIHTYYPEIKMELGYQVVISTVSEEDAEELLKMDVDYVDEENMVNPFGKKCDEILMEGGNSIFYHMDSYDSHLVIKDEKGTVVFDKSFEAIPGFFFNSFSSKKGISDDNDIASDLVDNGLLFTDYGCTNEEDFEEWQETKNNELKKLDYSSILQEYSYENEIIENHFKMVGIYEEEYKTVNFESFQSDSFNPAKLVRVNRCLPYHDDLLGESGFDLENLNDVGFLVYDDKFLGIEDNDFSRRTWHSFNLLGDGGFSEKYNKWGGNIGICG